MCVTFGATDRYIMLSNISNNNKTGAGTAVLLLRAKVKYLCVFRENIQNFESKESLDEACVTPFAILM